MLVLPCLALALSALALPGESELDIVGLLGGDSGTSNAWLPPDPTRAIRTLDPSTRFSVSQAVKPTLATSRSPLSQWNTGPVSWTEPTAIKTALASAPSILPASEESHVADRSSKTWQIIGITIIAVLFIATSISCAMFFDHFWRFLKDVICCMSRPLASEEFIPDCEKLRESASVHTIRPRELPWNIDTQDWNTLRRHPSRSHPLPV